LTSPAPASAAPKLALAWFTSIVVAEVPSPVAEPK